MNKPKSVTREGCAYFNSTEPSVGLEVREGSEAKEGIVKPTNTPSGTGEIYLSLNAAL
jgi:hypothetical protein